MITVIVVVVEKTESEPRELESGGPSEAIVGPTEEPVEEILGINLRGEEEKGGSAFPQHHKLPSSYSILCTFQTPSLPAHLPCHAIEKWNIGKKWNSGISIYDGNEAPCGFHHLKSC